MKNSVSKYLKKHSTSGELNAVPVERRLNRMNSTIILNDSVKSVNLGSNRKITPAYMSPVTLTFLDKRVETGYNARYL